MLSKEQDARIERLERCLVIIMGLPEDKPDLWEGILTEQMRSLEKDVEALKALRTP